MVFCSDERKHWFAFFIGRNIYKYRIRAWCFYLHNLANAAAGDNDKFLYNDAFFYFIGLCISYSKYAKIHTIFDKFYTDAIFFVYSKGSVFKRDRAELFMA